MENVKIKSSESFVRHQAEKKVTTSSARSNALQMAMDFDPSSNLADYTWENSTSSRWIPPQNTPHLTRRDMLQILSKENTLWIGDSTGRQDYHTLQALLWQPEPYESDYFNLGSLDFVDASPGNHTLLLEKDKNINKNPTYDRRNLWCKARGIFTDYRNYLMNVGLVAEQRYQEYCMSYPTNKTKAKRLPSTGKHDYAIAKTECWNTSQLNMARHKGLLKRYSVLVISNGVFYTIPRTPCTKNADMTAKEQTYRILDYLRDELASPSRTVIWKLFGPGKDTIRSLEQELAEAARSWFQENPNVIGMELADFRYAIRERSYGEFRIGGDSDRHWGLHARLLSLDLVARIIARTSSQSAR
eukprot:CAMPEP_0116081218 /NCGR_PEP_ID=MMETSP0327-20121206/2084_1 /TAXON_ID=44447 /ORGANISM="Pseudo-nitzschia delicatissima, Strain B596" /LENGTH=357 /DNA_ID=CAMNT_0003571947 /DNA_START=175 /DNA_END=1248 /DNA_ORIENTATION=-